MLTRIILTLSSLGEACSLSWRGRGCCCRTSRGLQLVGETHARQMRWSKSLQTKLKCDNVVNFQLLPASCAASFFLHTILFTVS